MDQDNTISDVIKKITDDLVWQRFYYNQYTKLFMYKDLRNQLLSDTALRFFKDLQRFFWHQMIMGISRLTDRYQQGNFRNLSIQILPILGSENNWDFIDELSNRVNETIALSMPVINMRKKHVAHRDFDSAMDDTVTLGSLELSQIDSSLTSLCDVMNFTRSNLDFPFQIWELKTPHGVDSLIYHLKIAHMRIEESKSSIEAKRQLDLEIRSSKYYEA